MTIQFTEITAASRLDWNFTDENKTNTTARKKTEKNTRKNKENTKTLKTHYRLNVRGLLSRRIISEIVRTKTAATASHRIVVNKQTDSWTHDQTTMPSPPIVAFFIRGPIFKIS